MTVIILTYIYLFTFGAVIGSFLNVCIYRIPRGLSIVLPPSYCPNCQQRIKPYDMVPIISYIILGGRCRYCKERISMRYPLVEALTGTAFVISFAIYGFSLQFLYSIILVALLIAISFIDIDEGIIPDALIGIGFIAGIAAIVFDRSISWQYGLYGALIGAGIIGAVYVLSWFIFKKEGIGVGDIKLMAMAGLFLGWQRTALAFLIGVYCGAIIGIALVLLKKKTMAGSIPFGPFLSIGIIISQWYGYEVIDRYLSLYLH